MMTKNRLKEIIHDIGFHACGITLPSVPDPAEQVMVDWTEQGKHGGMKYLERYQERRNDFWNRFHDAKSVIVLGINYYSECHPERSASQSSGGRPLGHLAPSDWLGEGSANLDSSAKKGLRMTANPTGRVARYAWGEDYHRFISKKTQELIQKLKEETNQMVYFESAVDTKPLLERTLSQQAGLGFIGKQTQLLSLQFGPWLFLSEIITNLELEPDQPYNGSCGTCRLCIDECPTEAIEETGQIDARKCIAYLTIENKSEIPLEFRARIKDWVFGCDECLNICPYTAKQKNTDWTELTSDKGFGPELNLLELFDLKTNGQYEKKFGKTAISRANRKQLLRNAAVVLGNVGTKEIIPSLKKALNEEGALLVQEHLRWAIGAIESRENG